MFKIQLNHSKTENKSTTEIYIFVYYLQEKNIHFCILFTKKVINPNFLGGNTWKKVISDIFHDILV